MVSRNKCGVLLAGPHCLLEAGESGGCRTAGPARSPLLVCMLRCPSPPSRGRRRGTVAPEGAARHLAGLEWVALEECGLFWSRNKQPHGVAQVGINGSLHW